MVTNPAADIELETLDGDKVPLEDLVTTFHLALVIVDPYTKQSAWLLPTIQRILDTYKAADVRVGFVVVGTVDEARAFLGPLVDEFFVLCDSDRSFVSSLGLETLPAWVHISHLLHVEASAQGWDPEEWRAVAEHLSDRMSWTRPRIPEDGDPVPFSGSAAT